MMRRLGCGVAIAVMGAFFLASSAWGQNTREITITGSVKSLQPRFEVTTEKDEVWILTLSSGIIPGEHIHITGEADPAWLQSGMLVRLSAKINTKKGKILEPISALEVVAYRPEIEPTLVDENQPKGTDDLLTTDKKPPKKPKPAKFPEEMTATIVGEIGSFKEGEISIKAPGKLLKGELAKECKISVDIADPRLVRVNDKVTIVADHYEAQAPSGGAPGVGAIKEINVIANEKFEPVKPLKRGQKPYDNAKPGDSAQGGKADDKDDAKPAAGKAEAGKPGAKPDAGKPAAGKPDAGKPAAGKVDPAKPGANKPAAVDPKKKP